MTELSERVLEIVRSIPAGRVTTYGDVARATGTGARVVGRMLHGSWHDIPWWRVVSADGRPYPGAAGDAGDRFIAERTPLVDDTEDVRVDLQRASWTLQD